MITDRDQNPFDSYINDLETSFKSFISIYNVDLIDHKNKHEPAKKSHSHSTEQTKSAIDQTVSEMYEKAHTLESQFLRHRLEITKNYPEEFLNEEIECLKGELARKEELLAETKKKVANCEQILRNFSNNLDNKFKNRIEMTTQGYIPNENQLNYPNLPSNQQPASISGNQSFEQPSSLDNSVILLQ